MRPDRNPYPFHNRQPQRPAVSIGYRPAAPLPTHRKRRLVAGAAGYLFAVSVAAKALIGFIAP
ncbi:hypothetical protein HDE80_001367 [Rhodanobacter sp. A1T4]|nr:hypothetical protein [Rhodanobacter sp. A1T4]